MLKRKCSTQLQISGVSKKRLRVASTGVFDPIKIATKEAAARVDAHPPFQQLLKALKNVTKTPKPSDCVIYWMRMTDLRRKALSKACEQGKLSGVPVVVLFVLSPQDYVAYDHGSRKIDFTLRNLVNLKAHLAQLHIPLHTVTYTPRKKIPEKVLTLLQSFKCNLLFANIEYEVDELRRDIELCKLALPLSIQVNLYQGKSIIEPGVLFSATSGKAYAVYSPYQKLWLKTANENLAHYLEEAVYPLANSPSIRQSNTLGSLFETEISNSIPGFELDDTDRETMEKVWPAGEDRAREILVRFLGTKARSSQLGAVDPLAHGAQDKVKHNRIMKYDAERDQVDKDTTSRLSPYLSSGVISAREVVRATMSLTKMQKIDANATTGPGRWLQEIIWRDFYTDVLASFPRVSMGRPFIEKYSAVVWENHQKPQDGRPVSGVSASKNSDSENLARWKLGQTGVPIVDAAMRCINKMGWVHNRARMIVAMYLTKHLMIDWRVGERHFMEKLVDGDLASNNGGWQWSASTGVDACPYFRIFNPHSQSIKADPSGDFIRHWIPELSKVRGPELHNPSISMADKLGYPRQIIEHKEGRDRALRRFKNPGDE